MDGMVKHQMKCKHFLKPDASTEMPTRLKRR